MRVFSSYSHTSSELSDKEVTKEPLKNTENFLQSCSNSIFVAGRKSFLKVLYGLSSATLLIEDCQVKQERMNNIEYCFFDMMLCVAC